MGTAAIASRGIGQLARFLVRESDELIYISNWKAWMNNGHVWRDGEPRDRLKIFQRVVKQIGVQVLVHSELRRKPRHERVSIRGGSGGLQHADIATRTADIF